MNQGDYLTDKPDFIKRENFCFLPEKDENFFFKIKEMGKGNNNNKKRELEK